MSDSIGLWVGGFPTTGPFQSTTKYHFNTNVASPGANLSIARSFTSACGNNDFAVIVGTANTISNLSEQYYHADNTVVPYLTLKGNTRNDMGSASNKDTAYFVGGTPTGFLTQSNLVTKMSFLSQAMTASLALETKLTGIAGCGNKTIGLFGGGYNRPEDMPMTTSDVLFKIDYATDVRTQGESLRHAAYSYGAASNETTALFSSGLFGTAGSAFTSKYDFATGAITEGTTLAIERTSISAMGNKERALFTGVSDSMVTSVESYDYATGVIHTATHLSIGRRKGAAVSNNHGGI